MTAPEPRAEFDQLDEVLTLSGPGFYLLVQISPEELESLSGVEYASWEKRTSIKAGQALGHAVFWSPNIEDATSVIVLVGHDDETWELALEIPAAVLLAALPSSP